MTILDPFADPIRRPYDASYPASILGPVTPPAAPWTWAVATATPPGPGQALVIGQTTIRVNVIDRAGVDRTTELGAQMIPRFTWTGGYQDHNLQTILPSGGVRVFDYALAQGDPFPTIPGRIVTLDPADPASLNSPISSTYLPVGEALVYQFGPVWNDGTPEPTDLAAIQAMGPLGNTTAWTTGQYVEDWGAGDPVHWDGSAWVAGAAPPPPPPPAAPTPRDSWTKAQIIAWLADHGVVIEPEAEDDLTKAELLAIVELVLNDDMEGAEALLAEDLGG